MSCARACVSFIIFFNAREKGAVSVASKRQKRGGKRVKERETERKRVRERERECVWEKELEDEPNT